MATYDENKPEYTSVVLGNHDQEGQSTGTIIDSCSQNSLNCTQINESKVVQIELNEEKSKEQHMKHVETTNESISKPLKRCSRLYGREKEQQQVLDAYRASQSSTESRSVVAIIKGSAGSGKTALAHSLKDQLRMDNGSMIPWTCDRQSILRIGAGFSVALRNWVDDMLSLSDKDLAVWKLQIMKPFDSFELGILVKHFPRLKSLFNPDDYATDQYQEYRYDWSTINTLMDASCSLDFPLVFLMDDFHWADPASFRWLFEHREMESKGSFFIFTYNSDVVEDKASWWFQELQGLTNAGFDIVEISLHNLDEDATQSIVSDVLEVGNEAITHISDWVHQQTMGNPLYVEELLNELRAREIITPDSDAGSWTFQKDKALDRSGGCTTVCEYLARRLTEVSKPTLEVLKVAACMGLRFDTKLVSSAMSGSAVPYLIMAKEAGILTVHELYKGSQSSTSEKVTGSPPALQFMHNSMHEAMLRVVGGRKEQEYLHLSIGRKLILNLSDKELKNDLLMVVEQVIKGASCIKEQEKCRLAQYALEAARKAVKLTSFESAKKSISFAISLLRQRSWRDDYDLTLAVYDAGAEIAYASGDFEDVEHMVAEVLRGGRTFEDKLQAHLTKVYALGSVNRTPEAIALGLDLLNQLGESFPTDPRRHHVWYAIVKTRYLLHGKSDEMILRLSTMTNSRAVSAMQIMNVIFASAYLHTPMLAPLLAIRMVQLSLEYGLCAVSSVAFSVYGMLLVSKKSRVQEGTRMGELSFKILDRFQAKAWLPRVHAAFYGGIHGWTRPHQMAFEPLLRGYRVGLETGDIEMALMNALLYLYFSFESGKPLKQLEEEHQRYIISVVNKHKNATILMINPLFSTVRVLIGEASELEHEAGHNKLNWVEAQRIVLAVIFCDYKEAVLLGRVFQEYPYEGYDMAVLYLFLGIANVALFKAKGMRNQRLRITARHCLKKIDRICPSTTDYCLGKLTLLQAEVSSLSSRRHVETVRKYLIAISLADSSNNHFERAVAHERYGRYLAERGDLSSSLTHLRHACSSYQEWNAYRKVEVLQEDISKIAVVS
ncbi:hypothetical protein MHU86_7564 [Fragilaria crotonensis]|nr:hypothetical protein MHU86_7564 [Fragilaria crotonensis]